jgi:hypothetical protein
MLLKKRAVLRGRPRHQFLAVMKNVDVAGVPQRTPV